MRLVTISSALALTATSAVLAGCAGFGSNTAAVVAPAGPITLNADKVAGSSFGGRQPITGATIQLWQTGSSGYGAGATQVPAQVGGFAVATTNTNGGFSIPAFTCTSGTQLYVVSLGGDASAVSTPPPGVGESGPSNPAAVLLAGLTSCDNVNAGQVTFVAMNEITTAATIWAVAPFMTSVAQAAPIIGASSTNAAGLAAAFSDISTLVNIESGLTPGTGSPNGKGSLPSGTVVPSAELNAIGNSLAACVNTNYTNGAGSPACTLLFNSVTGSPTDITAAALLEAKSPGSNPAGFFNAAGSTAGPYAPALSSAPNDFTIGISYAASTANGIASPTAIAIDASGNVFVANAPASGSASVSELSHLGVPLITGGTTGSGTITSPTALAIDMTGNVWVANGTATGSMTELTASSSFATGTAYTGGGLSTPTSIAFDGLGNIWLSNSGNNSASEFSSTGTAISGASGYAATGVSAPVGIAVNPH